MKKTQIIENKTDKVHQDFYELFTSNPNKDMLAYAYQNPEIYDNVTKCPDYYLFREEAQLIAQSSDILADCLQKVETVIELGPGSENGLALKTLPLLSYGAKIHKYIAVDISQSYLEKIGTYVQQHSSLNVELQCTDFVENKLNYIHYSGPKAIVVLGSTIGGFDKNTRRKCLKNISDAANQEDLFIITIDTNHDEESLLRAYGGKANNNFICDILNYYAKFNSDFAQYLSCFEFQVELDNSSTTMVHSNFVALKSFSFDIPEYGNVNIKRGQKFQLVRSSKFSEEEFFLDFASLNFKINKIVKFNNISLFVMEKQ
jgi:uncharacterized SAM-dependent methyltransferase